MKKIYSVFSIGAMFTAAVALSSCNNAEEAKKQAADQDAKIQSMVDAKFNDLQNQVNSACSTKIDSLANAQFAAYQEEEAKNHKGSHHTANNTKHVTPPAPAKTTPAPAPTTISNRAGTNSGNNNSTISNRAGTNTGTGNKTTISNRGGATTQPH